ncbi:ComB9 competence protein [Tistlia consotensis]|uniref:ComB9 competence protein n=1 Tax=Tistlia consotensis USBA 355 TaxID=560819 RepID=A0A1Y6CQL9_9PROT|nr:TrbG/VirB9 family P-type conjugative transfer protein [Tistlia consotensis]SMF81982.1 ComB9 competence protein [Tistlia consotensis USBA 355]SNS25000.1 ComB9 competence protein [Tistlia consotensis]
MERRKPLCRPGAAIALGAVQALSLLALSLLVLALAGPAQAQSIPPSVTAGGANAGRQQALPPQPSIVNQLSQPSAGQGAAYRGPVYQAPQSQAPQSPGIRSGGAQAAAPVVAQGAYASQAGPTDPSYQGAVPPGVFVGPLDQVQGAWDEPVAAPGQIAPGVRVAAWAPQDVIRLRVREFMVSSIYLPPCEEITDILVGDSRVFLVRQPRLNLVTVQVTNPEADTNLEIITRSGMIYSFYLRAEPIEADQLPDLKTTVTAPGLCGRPAASAAPAAAPASGSAPARASLAPFDPAALRFDDLGIFVQRPEDAGAAPLRVWHDGQKTYLDFGDPGDRPGFVLPAVFETSDGVDRPVNYWRAETTGPLVLVVEAVGNLTLKSGDRVVCIRMRDGFLPGTPLPGSALTAGVGERRSADAGGLLGALGLGGGSPAPGSGGETAAPGEVGR